MVNTPHAGTPIAGASPPGPAWFRFFADTARRLDAVVASDGEKQPASDTLTALAALTTTSFGRDLLELADAAAGRTALDIRDVLTADRTYYVRTDGSDSNTGLANTSGGAFLTIQKAVDVVATLDRSIYDVVISVADGTYTGTVTVDGWGPGVNPVEIRGNITTPANVLISVTGNALHFTGGKTNVGGFKVAATASGLVVEASSKVSVINPMDFGACTNSHINIGTAGQLVILANYTISGNAAQHWLLSSAHSILLCAGRTITLSGTRAFTTFLQANFFGNATIHANTFVGSATGTRYVVTLQALVFTSGAGATYLPGSVAGATGSQGQYV